VAPAFDPEALRRARVVAGLTQHELARRIGVAGGERVSQWERGTSEPRPGSVRQIARVLKVPAATLMANSADLDLRAMRTVAGLTASELAKRADISLSTLNRWEAGRFTRMPRRASVELLARALGRRVHEVEAALSHFVSKD